ncbi:integrase, catalytic region, zinc finger, CCHC-type containing protein [Tanacetum coccineum]
MSTQQDINAIRAQRLANTHDPLALMANTQTPFHPDHSSHITYIQHPQPNTNYMPQPMQNPKDSSDPTTTMNTTLALLAKAFKVNTIPTNNNQRSSLIPCNSQIAQSGMNMSQDIKIQMVDDNVGNQYGNRDVVTAPNKGNGNGINGNPIRCYNCRGEGHYASNCIVKSRKRDVAYLQQQLQIAQEEEAGIQSTQEECEFMAAYAYKETERVKLNCTLDDTLQQASTSGTQSDNAPVYDSDGSTEVPKDENCYDHDIFNMLTHEVQYTDLQTEFDRAKEKLENCIIKKEKEYAVLWNNWYTKCEECKYDKILYDKAYNDMQQKIKWLQAQLRDLKGNSSDTQCASNTLDPVSLILEDENMSLEFQTKSIIDSLQKQLYDTIYENAKLRAQLFDKVYEPKGTTKGTRTKTMFTKQSILVKPPSSFYKPKLYSVTPFPKSSVLPKVDKTNALSKPVTSNSTPSTRESKVVQTVNVIAPRIFRTNPSKTSRQQANSDSNGFSSTKVNNTAKTRRPHPRSNSNTDRVPSKSKITANHNVCVLNYVNDVNSRADNQTDNVSIRENQKKHKANAKKSKKLGSTGSLASSRPSKPRTSLRWIPIGRIFAMYGKLTTSSNTENKSEKSMCDNASTSNPLKPSSKGFLNSASLLGRLSRLRKQHTSIYPIVVL